MTLGQQAAPREYETIYVLRPDITKEGAEKVSNRVAEVMQREGGKLTQVENWGRRALAFPVANQRRAYYIYLKYIGGGTVVSELERNFRMLDTVLKYQTVKLRDDVDADQVTVDPEAVEFEVIEPPAEEEPEETLAEQLGLQEPPPREHRAETQDQGGGEADAAAETDADAQTSEGKVAAEGESKDATAQQPGAAGEEEEDAQ